MSKDSVIARLFKEPLSREEQVVYEGKDYEEASKQVLIKQRKLLNSLSQEQRKLFDEYEEASISLVEIEEDENFNQGFSLGIKVAVEAVYKED